MKKIITWIISICSVLTFGIIIAVIISNVIINDNKGKFKIDLEFFDYSEFEEFYKRNQKTYSDNFFIFDLSQVSGEHRYLVEGLDECHIHHNEACKENDSNLYHFVSEAKYYDYIYVNEINIKFNIKLTFCVNVTIDKDNIEWMDSTASSSNEYNYILKSGDNQILKASFSHFRDFDESNSEIIFKNTDNYLSSIKEILRRNIK